MTLPHTNGRTSRIREAALPLQKRPRRSRYARDDDPDSPEVVVAGKMSMAESAAALASAVPVQTPASLSSPRPVSSAASASVASTATAIAASAASAAASAAAASAAAASAAAASAAAASAPARSCAAVCAQRGLGGRCLAVNGNAAAMEGLSCHAREGYDLAGDAATWGLAFNVESAAESSAACAAQRAVCGHSNSRGKPIWRASRRERTQGRCSGAPGVCNSWVFCPGSNDTPGANDRCFSYTIHNHSKGECWLKHEANQSHPIAAGPTLPLRMRRAPRKDWPWAVATNVWPWEVPEKIHWQAGLLAERNAPVWRGTRLPDWHHKFCNGKHGPC